MGLKVCMDLEGSVEQIDTLNLSSGGELTINSGAITVTHSVHTVDTEADAGTDDLHSISGGSTGDIILLARANAARAVVLKHNSGNIKTPSGTDHELTALGYVILKHDGSNWHLQSGNGSGYLLNKLACLTIALENIPLNDSQVINGVNCANNSRVFLARQTNPIENGPWIVKGEDPYYPSSGDWVRPDDFQNGFSVSGHVFYIQQGTEYSDSIWMITNGAGEDIVGTDDLNAVNLTGGTSGGAGDSFDIVSLPEDSTNTSSDYLPKNDGTDKKIKRNDLLNPGFKTLDDAATITINLADPERTFAVVLGGNRTLAIVNASVGDEFWVKLIQDGSGSHTVTWWDTINWSGGSAPTLTTTADKADYLFFKCSKVNTYDCLHSILKLDTNSGDSVALGENIVAAWSMDETSGTRYDSVASYDLVPNDSIGSQTGKSGNAAFITSSHGFLASVPEASSLDFRDDDFTIAMWVKFYATDSGVAFLARGLGGAYLLYADFDATNLCFEAYSDSLESNIAQISTSVFTAGTWHLVVIVHSTVDNRLKLSVDASEFALRNHFDGMRTADSFTSTISIANQPNDLHPNFNVDEVTIWDKALTQEEVTALYNSGSGLFYPFV